MSLDGTRSGLLGVSLLVTRIIAGGVFVFAASVKISDPQAFFEAVRAFKILQSTDQMLLVTHALPWVELLAGAALVVGLWTRAAAFIIAGLLAGFIGAVASVLWRGLNVHCGCFGGFRLVCGSEIAWCKVFENAALTAITLVPLAFGGGRWSVDAAMRGREGSTGFGRRRPHPGRG